VGKDTNGSCPPELIQRIELEIDSRLCDVLLDALDWESWGDSGLAALLRLAYVSGYQTALQEPRRGQLFSDLGLAVPERTFGLSARGLAWE
jgi:hypothetical protein